LHTTGSLYDVAIIGGGLAGLSLSINLAGKGYRVLLLEKESYPFNRVCGEYISMESWPFLERLGIPLSTLSLPRIHTLTVSAPDGYSITHPLTPGGFGISRYTLDALLAERAAGSGVALYTGHKVTGVTFTGNRFHIASREGSFQAAVAVGSFGKRSNLDVRMQRPFIRKQGGKLNNYIGIKYHIRVALPPGQIGLHNFENGYCGVSGVDGDKHCLCYLTTAANLEKNGNSIRQMEQAVLYRNPHLRDIFTRAEFIRSKPESIARISFEQKSAVDQHLLMTGDSAGMISPLCGNGMSMAFRSGLLAMEAIQPFLEGTITRGRMENSYQEAWEKQFSARMKTGRLIQSFFGKPGPTKLFLQLLRPFPIFIEQIIRRTHGNAF
jgi:flavin-dependent dehydrogenase